MSVFASYFWLWSIVGYLAILMLSTLGAVMNIAGFVRPLKGSLNWLDDAPLLAKLGVVAAMLLFLVYPSTIHHLWASAKAEETRGVAESIPAYPASRATTPLEEMRGLFDPTGTEGTYVIRWYGSKDSFAEVRSYYDSLLLQKGWSRHEEPLPAGRRAQRNSDTRAYFRDHAEPSRAHYEILLSEAAPGSRDAPSEIANEPTLYTMRLGIVDPRATTQVAWFIDCLVRRAPTFPTCEALGWNPLESALQINR